MLTSAAVDLFLDAKRSENRRPATISYYGYELSRLTALYPDLPSSPLDLHKVLATVKGAPASRHATFRALRAFYRWLLELEVITANPMAKIKAPAVPKQRQRTLDQVDVDRLLAEAQLTRAPATSRAPNTPRPCSFRDFVILTLILDSAIRSAELRRLRGRDLRDGWIDVRGKRGERQVPVHPDTLVLLQRLVLGPDDPIFRTIAGRPLSRRRLHGIITVALRRVELADGKHGPHLLRHTFGRWWVGNGGSLPALQEILGHEDIKTTMIYVKLHGSEVKSQHSEHSKLTAPAADSGLRKVG